MYDAATRPTPTAGEFSSANQRTLCVDLDGTLIGSDTLWECFVSVLRDKPTLLSRLPLWLLSGRAHLKQQLARVSPIDASALPYREEVVTFLRRESASGRSIMLATAADKAVATAVADHLGLFDAVIASDGQANLKGHAKATRLVEMFGARQFDYIGNSTADIPVWQVSAMPLLAGGARIKGVDNLHSIDSTGTPVTGHIGKAASFSRVLLKTLRPHQWIKNLLVLVPALAAHRFDSSTIRNAVLALIALSLCASGGYIFNDLLDVSADRRHARKRHRPFASGRLSIGAGAFMVVLTWLTGFGIGGMLLSPMYAAVMLAYVATTVAYSAALKRVAVLDVMILAGLYVFRVITGGVATGIAVSNWLLAFTLFVSLSLAFMKRFIEVRAVAATGGTTIPGRGYRVDDGAWLHSAGLTSSYLSAIILALYATSSDVTRLYSHPDRLLFACPVVLYWATRTWLLAHRGEIHDDPVVAVATDPVTYVVLGLTAIALLQAV